MDPFDKHIPSVFVASSPFQVLCSVAVIKQLEIKDFVFYTRLPNGGARNDQTINVLKTYKIPYNIIDKIGYLKLLLYILKAIIKRKSKYKRLFICDMRSVIDYYIGSGYVSDNASVVYLDDGGATLSFLYNETPIQMKNRDKQILSCISRRRNLIFQKNLLTIYDAIANNKYNIETLSLNNIFKEEKAPKSNQDIVFVGTNTDAYCQGLNIPLSIFWEKQSKILRELKQSCKNEKLLFISHGLDVHQSEILSMIDEIGCDFLRPQNMIELEMIARGVPPREIYGFTSTALLTLKSIFPQTHVVNIMFKQKDGNNIYNSYIAISNYYKSKGIDLVEIEL